LTDSQIEFCSKMGICETSYNKKRRCYVIKEDQKEQFCPTKKEVCHRKKKSEARRFFKEMLLPCSSQDNKLFFFFFY
jgi:hypothetical protein